MSREVRRVPADWQHPKTFRGGHKPLHEGDEFASRLKEWEEGCAAWNRGEFPKYASEKNRQGTYEEWAGPEPLQEHYMPAWSEEEKTHYQMYETTSEGTPISPVMETPEELARWLADNNASTFANYTTDYETWLKMITGSGSSVGTFCVTDQGDVLSGVEVAAAEND